MSEYTVTGYKLVKDLLIVLYPYLRLKRPIAKLVLEIIEEVKTVETKADFLEVSKIVDKIGNFTDSKKRKNTSELVERTLFPPVETESIELEISKKSS